MPSTREFDFVGSQGHLLSGRLELPDGPPLATAVFAHCFTCTKDHLASVRVSRGLAEQGFAVLRFDFTGLGASAGSFAESSFTGNVGDLVAAAEALAAELAPPRLLVGHSLGGPTCVAAAARLSSVGAVVTLNSPLGPDHIVRLAARGTPDADGAVTVDVGGRPIAVSRHFLDDAGRHDMAAAVAALGRPLLVMHDPEDPVVPAAEAWRILSAAGPRKAFQALEGAGHLVGRRDDADHVARTIALWAGRALKLARPPREEEELPPSSAPGTTVREAAGGPGLRNLIRTGRHLLAADEPESVGGADSAPTPHQLLEAALGACTSLTLRLYAKRKGWPLARITVHVAHEHVADAAAEGGKADLFRRRITLEGALDEEMRARLLDIANRCPVHRALANRALIETALEA